MTECAANSFTAPEIKDKLFQPFFATKPAGEGTGLGLSISYDIVTQQHGGATEVDTRIDEFHRVHRAIAAGGMIASSLRFSQ